MKITRPSLAVILVVVGSCILIGLSILFLHTPIIRDNHWIGQYPIDTTTPTLTIFPGQGWWTSMPTAPGLEGFPAFPTAYPSQATLTHTP